MSASRLARAPVGGAATKAPVRFVVVDDHELVRGGLRQLLAGRSRFEYAGEAASAAEAVEVARAETPDLVVLDLRLPDGSGVDACREIVAVSPASMVLILTAFPSLITADAARQAGARGYLTKRAGREEILDAVARLLAGEEVFELLQGGRPFGPLRHLTTREGQVLAFLARGWTNREIAQELALAEKTIKNYVSMILLKLGVENRAAAAALFVREVEQGGGPATS